ncbi:hypothetical protein ABW20_dc0109474 [Dactylellina cionopaga]|nr:hypothetical protein ABW20_dc0109474 [Dactylellina cionopaga]
MELQPCPQRLSDEEYGSNPSPEPKAKPPWWFTDSGLRRLNFSIGVIFLSAAANGFDSSLINGLLIIQSWLPFFIPASYLSDKMGRRWCLIVGSIIMFAASVVQTAVKGVHAFMITRGVIGAGLAFNQAAAGTLAMEIAHPRHREWVTIFYNAFWYLGAFISAVSTFIGLKYFATRDLGWRLPCLTQTIIPGIQILFVWAIPESPRFLIAAEKCNDAKEMLCRYHANGNQEDPIIDTEMRKIADVLAAEKKGASDVLGKCKFSWCEFARGRANRQRGLICVLVGVMIQWTGNGKKYPF